MSFINWCVMLIPVIGILGLAVYSRKYVRGVADYLAAGRVAGRYVISVGDLSTMLGVITIIALVEQQYQCGFALNFWNHIIMPISIVTSLTGYCLYRFRETKAMSMGQFLEMRYNRPFRIFAASLRTIAEMLTNAIGPAVAARFFIYFLGLPHAVTVFGVAIPSFVLILILCLILAMVVIWPAGRVSLIVTDCFQGLISYPIFVIFVFFILGEFSWSAQIAPVMANRVAGESFLDPYDINQLRDFNLFALVVTVTNNILNRASWIGNDTSGCGKSPHEQKMAGIIGSWRNGFGFLMCMIIAIGMITLMAHRDFAPQAKKIRNELSAKVAAETVEDSAVRRQVVTALAAQPEIVFQEGEKFSRVHNPDTEYLGKAADIITKQENGNATYQGFRTLYYQMMMPVVLRNILPGFMIGLIALLMIMLMLSTDDSRIFNASSTIVQDIIMPLKKEPLTPKQHLWYLRFLSLGVAVFFLCGSIFLAQMDYINMFLTIMTSIWCGGAGPVMIGGLYSRFGTTAGAFASLIGGAVVSVGGIAMQQNWAERIYPWLARLGYCDSIDYMLQTISAPFSPYIVWKMDALKFPINSMEIFFIAMITGILCYVVVSLITFKKPYNLDQMLHRGIYSIDGEKRIKSPWTWRNVFSKLINITPEYTCGDKIIAWSVFFYSFVYQLLFMFVIVVVWNAISPWPKEWWSTYFYFGSIIVACVVGIISTVWMVIGGCIDLRRLFLDLAARVDNPLDDGRVEGNISLMDRQKIDEIKEKGGH